jgi:hypothetical protein
MSDSSLAHNLVPTTTPPAPSAMADASPVTDTPGDEDRFRMYCIDDRGHQREGAPHRPMPTSFRSLCDDDVGAEGVRLLGASDVLHLKDQSAPGILDRRHEGAGVAER